ncbi:MAG: enolase C-terminal domain-like protein [Candidatus Zixiibacteriota bacterium]
MKCEISPIKLKLKNDFVVAGGKASIKNNFVVRLDEIGLGEAAGSIHYGVDDDVIYKELIEIAEIINRTQPDLDDFLKSASLYYSLPAICALSTAWHDLHCKQNQSYFSGHFHFPEPFKYTTSLTVSVGDMEQLKQFWASNIQIIKLKMNNELSEAKKIISYINQNSNVKYRIDANSSWDYPLAEYVIKNVKPYRIEMIEQPFDYDKPNLWEQLRANTDIPIIMDESINTPADIIRAANIVDGVNIKIQKTGMLETVIEMIKTARGNNLKVMLGCMIESSIGIATAYSLSGMADFIDLDGALLVENDPFVGLSYINQYLKINGKYGHGITMAE